MREKVGRWLIRVKRHTTYPESSADAEQERLRLLSPDDRMLFLGGRRPGDSDTWDGTGDGSQALFSQFVSLPLSDALPAHIEAVEGCCVRLEAGADILAGCEPFAAAIRAHADSLSMDAVDRERKRTGSVDDLLPLIASGVAIWRPLPKGSKLPTKLTPWEPGMERGAFCEMCYRNDDIDAACAMRFPWGSSTR